MSKITKQLPGIAALRMKMAINHFKRLLLGDLHESGKAQAYATVDALGRHSDAISIFDRTWDSWFANPGKIPKRTTIKVLDDLAASTIKIETGRRSLPPNTFSNMVHGGLVSSMRARSKAKLPLEALMTRVREYRPDSALHLHLDAVEMCALVEGCGDISWETVKRIGAERILELLLQRWGPRHGSMYPGFSSRLRLEWEIASPEERSEIRKGYARFRPDLFDSAWVEVARPAWAKTGIGLDISANHAYKLLFALAADVEFLKADRLQAWSLDLATAALALHALAWSDRYRTFGDVPITDELMYWIALDEILFSSTPLDAGSSEVVRAMMLLEADWGETSFGRFQQAREIYQSELSELDITVHDILATAMQATQVHPLEYRVSEDGER